MATVHQRHGQTDRQTDGRTTLRLTVAIPRNVHSASRGKNGMKLTTGLSYPGDRRGVTRSWVLRNQEVKWHRISRTTNDAQTD